MKIVRWAPDDAVLREGEAAVMIRGSVVRLAPLSTVVFTLTEQPIDVEDLARELEAHFGVPSDGSTLHKTKDAVAELIRYGILRRV